MNYAIQINDDDGRFVVGVCYDGNIHMGAHVSLDDASRQFWDKMSELARAMPMIAAQIDKTLCADLNNARAQIEALEKQLAERDAIIADRNQLLVAATQQAVAIANNAVSVAQRLEAELNARVQQQASA